ncbi:probable serine/threonine-protein kinase clkA [Sitodiplosis mosellana]|uniref:probable serine/threonine-protein kinase clkA n=1 Tax=Sitodiplosis mosellana TaxID=263140 RepID=UPI002444A136|nr:probable serine/threonine-protein kinase clkA [Sitodiplosis mosellana]
MGKFYLHVLFIVILILNIDSQFKISASPQLDIPLNHTRGLTSVENQRRIQTNSHTDKELNDSVAKDKEQSNEISIGDTLHYDRDRSQRYGPPYSEENDRHYYYNNENHDENYKSRYLNRNLNGENEGVDDDDDDKYYTQPRSPYYISEKQRNHLGYRDYYSTYNGNYNRYGNNNPYDGNLYDDRNSFNGDRNLYNDDRKTRINNNPRYDNDDDNYSDRNRYSNRDYEQYRLDLERKNRVEDANLRRILADVDKLSSSECFLNVGAQWSFETNVNEATQQESILAQQRYSQFQRELWEKIQTIDKSHIYDDKLYRQVRFMSIIGPNALPPDQFDRVS